MKKKTKYQTNIFLSREMKKLHFFYLRREPMRIDSEIMNLCLTFYFFKQKNKEEMQE